MTKLIINIIVFLLIYRADSFLLWFDWNSHCDIYTWKFWSWGAKYIIDIYIIWHIIVIHRLADAVSLQHIDSITTGWDLLHHVYCWRLSVETTPKTSFALNTGSLQKRDPIFIKDAWKKTTQRAVGAIFSREGFSKHVVIVTGFTGSVFWLCQFNKDVDSLIFLYA